MGNTEYSKSTSKRSMIDKFITWLNGIDFEDDNEAAQVLTEIKAECNNRLNIIAGEDAVSQAESEGS
jgi:hypothetical protein